MHEKMKVWWSEGLFGEMGVLCILGSFPVLKEELNELPSLRVYWTIGE